MPQREHAPPGAPVARPSGSGRPSEGSGRPSEGSEGSGRVVTAPLDGPRLEAAELAKRYRRAAEDQPSPLIVVSPAAPVKVVSRGGWVQVWLWVPQSDLPREDT